jgi:hypothetical protein
VLERKRAWGVKIELEIPCSKCGYVLKGLDTRGRCPECGAAVVESVFGDRLEYAARPWVWRLWAGALAVQIAVGVMTCAMVCTVVPVAAFSLLFVGWGAWAVPPKWLMVAFYTTFYVLPGVCSAGALGGWWLLTSVDPALAGRKEDPRVRRALRVVIGVEAGCWVVLAGLGMGGLLGAVPPGVYVPMASVCGLIAPLAMLVHVFMGARYVRWMEPRLRSPMVEGACWCQSALGWVAAGMVVVAMGVGMAGSSAAPLVLIVAFVAVTSLAVAHCVMVGCVRVGAGEAVRRRGGEQVSG